MNKNIVVLAALALGAVSVSAQDAAPAVSVTSSFGYESEYVFRGQQFADAIITPAIDVAYGDFYAGVWFAVPVENTDGTASHTAPVNEMDVYGGYSTGLGDILSIDVGVCRYSYDDVTVDFLDKDNTLEGYVGLSADVLLSPSVYLYRDFDLSVTTLEGSIGHSFAVSDAMSIDLGGSLGYATDDDDDYTYYGVTADLSYSINESSSISVGLRYSGATEDFIYDGMDYGKQILVNGEYVDDLSSSSAFWYGISFSTGF